MAATIGEFHRGFGLAGRDGRVLERPGVVASVCPAIGFRSIFNAAAYADAGALREALPELRREWESAAVNAWGVWAPGGDEETAALLTREGLKIDSSPVAMAAPVGAIGAPEGGVTVEEATDLAELDAVLAGAYEFPPGVMVYSFPGLIERFRCSVARDDRGEAVAALATVDADGDLGFTMVGTRPEARGRGFASELMCHAVAQAAERGCTTTSLQASAMGRGVYARLGYEDLGVYHLWEHRTPAPWERDEAAAG
jgi:ribosomal protein S18 acetylase RimI-like enzyme